VTIVVLDQSFYSVMSVFQGVFHFCLLLRMDVLQEQQGLSEMIN